MTYNRWLPLALICMAGWVAPSCGGTSFKMLQTPYEANEGTTTRLKTGAEKLGCQATGPDATGEIGINCPDGSVLGEGTINLGPPADTSEDNRLLGMCRGDVAESCGPNVEKIMNAGSE